MANREEALRRIFEATGVEARLSDEQKRELLAHLEDAVEAKVAAGIPEMDAVGQAFVELGDLKRIARSFPAPAAVAATAEGPRFRVWSGSLGEMGYLFLLFFTFVQLLITPALVQVFIKVRVPLPGLTLLFWTLSGSMRTYWPLLAAALIGLAVVLYRFRRPGKGRTALNLVLGLGSAALLGGVFAGVLLPFVSLLQGLQR
ncbi:MAG: hypothetical protein HY293_21390 [Planctomycetes bacterium]|nr:hypothetical protein [Planctomycetota bacterium]